MGAEERIRRAADLHGQGLRTQAIADQLGVSRRQVGRDLQAAQIRAHRPGRPRLHPKLERGCESCGRRFEPVSADAAKGRGRFCSSGCWGEALRIHPRAEPRPCVQCESIFTPSGRRVAAGYGRFCSHSCRIRWVWWNGLVSPLMLRNPLMKEIWHGRWGGKLGGRPRAERDPSKISEVLRLRAANPRLGERPIAERVGISRRVVREILAAQTS